MAFTGHLGAFTKLVARGSLLMVATLGLYRFWFLNDVRRYLWSHVQVGQEPFEWTGRPRELLLGFLGAIALLSPVYTGAFIATLSLGTASNLIGLVAFLLLFILGQYGSWRARRYRLSRTVYRGIRFRLTGHAVPFAVRAGLWWLGIVLTLGALYPWAQADLERQRMRHTHYGSLDGDFVGTAGALLRELWLLWLIAAVPLAIALVVGLSTDVIGAGADYLLSNMLGMLSPQASQSVGFIILAAVWAGLCGLAMYPAFQAKLMRWRIDGMRFGPITVRSGIRAGHFYELWLKFIGWSLLWAFGAGIVFFIGAGAVGGFLEAAGAGEIVSQTVSFVLLLFGYIALFAGFGVILWRTVRFGMIGHAIATAHVENLGVLDTVGARAVDVDAVGEGLADALDIGGI